MSKQLTVLMINGSPRANGNTSIALDEMVKISREKDILLIVDEVYFFWNDIHSDNLVMLCE